MKKNWLTFKGDGRVTKTEFVTLWQSITHGNQETAEAFFYLADLNDDNIIDSKDLSPLYNVFDTDGKHKNTDQSNCLTSKIQTFYRYRLGTVVFAILASELTSFVDL